MRPIIGIITRKDKSKAFHDIDIIYSDIVSMINKSEGNAIGVFNKDINDYLNICDGFILQGGDDIEDDNIKLLDILYKMNKPVLGICLGMQEMGVYRGGKLVDIDNHLGNGLHEIIIDKNSLLYRIIGKDKILVNSRHKSMIKDTKLFVSSKSMDNVIESIEDNNKKFFLGVQWHPENMYNDDDARKIFDYFIKMCHH